MKLKELYGKLKNNDEEMITDKRESCLAPLSKLLCKISIAQIQDFQAKWDGNRTFDEFVKAQNQQFVECIDFEISKLGKIVRSKFGLEPLSWEIEI